MSEMRLSEAMRLAGMATQQGTGSASVTDPTAPCAIGGALLAIGQQLRRTDDRLGDSIRSLTVFSRYWPIVSNVTECPECGGCDTLRATIWHLNDLHQWSRARIADFVETIEQAQTTPERETVSASVSATLKAQL